jgi:branched-chain amino acid transport system permease protein
MLGLLNNYYLQVLTFIGINGLLGLSVYLVLSTGQLTLGNAGFMSVGAYTAALMATTSGLSFWLTIPTGAIVAALVAVPLGYACLRLRGVYLAIATLGFTETVRVIMQNWEFTGGALGVKNIPNINKSLQRALQGGMDEAPFGLTFDRLANIIVLLGIALLVGLAIAFVIKQGRGRVGRAYAAIRTDQIAASAMGINTTYYKVLAFVQGAFLAGLAGGLTAHTTYFIGPTDFGFSRAVEMLTYVVVGGSGVPLGPILGAAVLIMMSEGLRDFRLFGARMADYRPIIYGALLMIVVTVRPLGLLTPALARLFRKKVSG